MLSNPKNYLRSAGNDVSLTFSPNLINLESLQRQLSNMPGKFPEIQGGGSLILAWQVKDKHVLVVGGGEVSSFLVPSVSV